LIIPVSSFAADKPEEPTRQAAAVDEAIAVQTPTADASSFFAPKTEDDINALANVSSDDLGGEDQGHSD
jgi:hypothetical protein